MVSVKMTYVLISENLTFRLCPFPRDNDRSSLNCASMLKGGWWWKSCGRGLNGLYLTNPQDLTARQGYYFFEIISHAKKLNIFFFVLLGVVWFRWKGWDYSLKRSQMMIRPKSLSTKTKWKRDSLPFNSNIIKTK